MTVKIDRMWINQPSTLQPLHQLHGKNVLAVKEGENMYRIYFLSGDTISMRAHSNTLSWGWK
jgi:hypothetical protein